MSGSWHGDGLAFAEEIVARAVRAGADGALVEHALSERFEINFEITDVSLLRTTLGDSTSLTLYRDGKKGGANFNGRAEEQIQEALDAALEAAAAGVPDEANQLAAQTPAVATAHGPETPEREGMFDAVLEYIDVMARRYPHIKSDLNIYAFNTRERCCVNSMGVRQRERRGSYHFVASFAAKDGKKATSFNYSGASSFQPFGHLLEVGTLAQLLDETMQSLEPRPVPEKFVGDVIVTPDCMGALVRPIAGALDGYALMSETTPYLGRKGEQIASAGFSLLNRPLSPDFPDGADFDGYGVPSQDLDVISQGRLEEFMIDFYIAKKLGLPQTCGPKNFVVPAGESSLAEIIANTERGIILSRFSGGRPNSKLDFSGVAKNSFYVEDGKIQGALIETMIAGNFQELLQNIRAISRETVNFGHGQYPYLAASGVTISGK